MTTRRGPSAADGDVPAPVRADRRASEVSMRDVATRAGVSVATVSRVLNGADTVGAVGRERVRSAVAELGYRPNRLARNLRRQTAEMIGIVVSDIENPHFTEMVRVVEDGAYGRGYRLLLCNSDERADKQAAYLDMLAGERVSGVILTPTASGGAEIGQLLDLGIPVVAFDRRVEDPRADSVVSDGERAVRTATEHLLAAGRRCIAYVGGRHGISMADERRRGYERAMEGTGLPTLEVDGEFRIDSARTATAELLRDARELDALVVANNLMAIGALEALAEDGRRVPEDIAIVSLDDPFWANLVQPPLTVLAQPVRALGDTAMRLLLGRIEGDDGPPRHEVFPFTLRVRGSCGTQHTFKERKA